MILTRQNLRGGKRLTGFPISEDSGMLGYKLGYCKHCNEPILMAMRDRDELMSYFAVAGESYEKVRKLLKPKVSFKKVLADRLITVLGGQVTVENDTRDY